MTRLFKKITEEKLTPEEQRQIYRYVDGQRGYKVVCGRVSCIFEFEAYRYCGELSHPDDGEMQGSNDAPNARSPPHHPTAADDERGDSYRNGVHVVEIHDPPETRSAFNQQIPADHGIADEIRSNSNNSNGFSTPPSELADGMHSDSATPIGSSINVNSFSMRNGMDTNRRFSFTGELSERSHSDATANKNALSAHQLSTRQPEPNNAIFDGQLSTAV